MQGWTRREEPPVIPWVTMETLAPDVISVASVGDAPRDFAGWQRVLQRLLAKMPACYDSLATRDIAESVRSTRRRAIAMDTTVPTNSGRYRLLTRPVFGPDGEVHAVRVWLGPASAPVPPLRPAVGLIWDLDSQIIRQPDTVLQLTGGSGEAYVPTLSLAELFYRITDFDRHAELLELLYDPERGGRLQFDTTVRAERGRIGRWRITIRTRSGGARGAWWLIEDVTRTDSTPPRAGLESTGLREAHRRAGTHLALLQLECTSIAYWLTDPAPWVRWNYLFNPVDVFHPDDRDHLRAQGERLWSSGSAAMTIRTLNYVGAYAASRLLLYPHPGFEHRQLAIAQLSSVGAAEAVGDPGLPIGPVGYDAQLRHDQGTTC